MSKKNTILYVITGMLIVSFIISFFAFGAQTLLHPSLIATSSGSNGQVLMISNGKWIPAATSSNVTSSATTTVVIDSSSATQGGCLKMKNATGTGYTYMTFGYGVATFSTISCE